MSFARGIMMDNSFPVDLINLIDWGSYSKQAGYDFKLWQR